MFRYSNLIEILEKSVAHPDRSLKVSTSSEIVRSELDSV